MRYRRSPRAHPRARSATGRCRRPRRGSSRSSAFGRAPCQRGSEVGLHDDERRATHRGYGRLDVPPQQKCLALLLIVIHIDPARAGGPSTDRHPPCRTPWFKQRGRTLSWWRERLLRHRAAHVPVSSTRRAMQPLAWSISLDATVVRVLAGRDGSAATRGSARAIDRRISSVAAGRPPREFGIQAGPIAM